MLTILLIENENLIALDIKTLLSHQRFNLIETMDVWLGIQIARELKPDVILSNFSTQTRESYKLLKKLRQDSRSANIPFIFITTDTDPESRELAFELGADEYLTMPIESENLLAVLDAYLAQSCLTACC
jgi:DNA-binding response OmpR family regulator